MEPLDHPERILVVNDTPQSLEMIIENLTFDFTDVHGVESIADARRMLERAQEDDRPFDALVQDMDMGSEGADGGLQFLIELRNDRETADLPIIIVSAHPETEFHWSAEAISKGADYYCELRKVVTHLPPLLKACIRRARARSALKEEATLLRETLRQILPREIADEVALKRRPPPRHYESATVLFTDFVGFTKSAEHLEPAKLVGGLTKCFDQFDRIVYRHGVNKIQTIGDAYFACGGVPTGTRDHPLKAVRAALDMRDFALAWNERCPPDEAAWPIRIGLHTGNLTGGVSGQTGFRYDLWGSTVNTGARVESGAEPGTVCVSETTRNLVEPFFDFGLTRTIHAKGLGEIPIFPVLNLKEELRRDVGKYNELRARQFAKPMVKSDRS